MARTDGAAPPHPFMTSISSARDVAFNAGPFRDGLRPEGATAMRPRQQGRSNAPTQAWRKARLEYAAVDPRFDAMPIAPGRLPRHLLATFDASKKTPTANLRTHP